MPFVLDASSALAVALEEEIPDWLSELFESIHADGAQVPSIWRFEIANTLLVAVRRQRINLEYCRDRLLEFGTMPIHVDNSDAPMTWTTGFELASRHGLSSYDAAYLELAVRRNLPLATLDKALARAARAEAIEVIGG